jgi:Na+/proline symporter
MGGQSDYLVAGRQLGPLMIAMSLFATWFGAETVIGSSAAIAEGGLSEARAEPFGYALCLLLMGLLVAGKLRAGGYLTLGDFFRDRFGPISETLCVIVNVATAITWAAAQLTALSLIVSSLTDLPVQVTLAGAALLVIVYVAAGGLMGDVVTDVIQGVVLIFGLGALLFAVILRAGGLGEAFALIPEGSLNLMGPGETIVEKLDAWAIPILGSLVTVEAVGRFLGAKTPRIASIGAFGGAGLYIVLGIVPVLIGLIGGQLGLPVGEGEAFLPALAQQLLSPIMLVILVGALLSAVLSTVDSNILASSGLLTRNLLDRFRPAASDHAKLWSTRLVTIGCGLFAWAIATRGESIYTLVEWTSALGTSGVLVAFLFGAWSRVGGERAAVAAIAAGLVCNVFTMLLPAIQGQDEVVGAFLLSILVSLIAYVAAAAVLRGRAGVATLGD